MSDELVARLRAAGCVFAEREAELLTGTAGGPAELEAMVRRRMLGTPLEVVVGWAGFRGLRVAVAPGVFVPRRRSEFLVEQAVALGFDGAVVLDMCCGSGALGLAVAVSFDSVELHAADIDPAAVRCARRNVATVGGVVYQGDLDGVLPDVLRGRVDLMLVNAPYVPSGSIEHMPREAREAEPRLALDGGPDGLDVHRRVASVAARWLAPTGSLLVETSSSQAEGTRAAMAAAGLPATVAHSQERGATVVIGSTGVPG